MKNLKPSFMLIMLFVLFYKNEISQAQALGGNFKICYCIPVNITGQPVNPIDICAGNGVASFTVKVSGTGPFTYKWQENLSDISNGGVYSGTNDSTLILTNPSYALNGKSYRCIVTNCSGQTAVTNTSAVLTLHTLTSDIDKDGITNTNDFSLLVQNYNTTCVNCPEDINQDGDVNIKDFLQLLSEFNKICY